MSRSNTVSATRASVIRTAMLIYRNVHFRVFARRKGFDVRIVSGEQDNQVYGEITLVPIVDTRHRHGYKLRYHGRSARPDACALEVTRSLTCLLERMPDRIVLSIEQNPSMYSIRLGCQDGL